MRHRNVKKFLEGLCIGLVQRLWLPPLRSSLALLALRTLLALLARRNAKGSLLRLRRGRARPRNRLRKEAVPAKPVISWRRAQRVMRQTETLKSQRFSLEIMSSASSPDNGLRQSKFSATAIVEVPVRAGK